MIMSHFVRESRPSQCLRATIGPVVSTMEDSSCRCSSSPPPMGMHEIYSPVFQRRAKLQHRVELPEGRQTPATRRRMRPIRLIFPLLFLSRTVLHSPIPTAVRGTQALSGLDNGTRKKTDAMQPHSLGQERGYHVVFSTSCSPYHEWQSYAFFYHVRKSGQLGTVTRIVAGCTSKARRSIERLFRKRVQPMSDRFQIHFTPDYSRVGEGQEYVYFNKPFGMKHWMDDVLGNGSAKKNGARVDDDIVILMDPDQLLLRPFTNDFSNSTEVWYEDTAPRDPFQDTLKVEHGTPFAQSYELWHNWTALFPNMSDITLDPNSPASKLSLGQIRQRYRYGPPYIATVRDMYRIVKKWSEFAPRVHAQYPELLAEMYAYCIAAAHLELPHRMAQSFMVSNVEMNETEAWSMVDDIPTRDICRLATYENIPHTLHYCQDYKLDNYHFYKGSLLPQGTILSCHPNKLPELPEQIAVLHNHIEPEDLRKASPRHEIRNAFMLCTLIPKLNEVTTYFQQNHCRIGGGWNASA